MGDADLANSLLACDWLDTSRLPVIDHDHNATRRSHRDYEVVA
jgi:hypothetical protein